MQKAQERTVREEIKEQALVVERKQSGCQSGLLRGDNDALVDRGSNSELACLGNRIPHMRFTGPATEGTTLTAGSSSAGCHPDVRDIAPHRRCGRFLPPAR